MYAQQINGEWRELVGNVEFSPTVYQTAESLTDEQRSAFAVFPMIDAPRAELLHTQTYGDAVYTLSGSEVVRHYPVIEKMPEQMAADTAGKASEVRAERNRLLAASVGRSCQRVPLYHFDTGRCQRLGCEHRRT